MTVRQRVCRILPLLVSLAALGACAPQSRLLREPVTGAELLDRPLSAAQTGVSAELERVIVRDSPGTWVRASNWDEYLLQITNAGATNLRLVSATLISEHLGGASSSHELAQLERQTSAQLRALQSIGISVGAGYAGGAVAFAAVGGGSSEIGVVAGASAAAVMIPIGLIAGGVYIHARHKRQRLDRELIAAEIENRALPLESDIAPGATVRGSLFFPVTPQPQRLSIRYTTGSADETAEISIDLAALAQLHVRRQMHGARTER